MLQLIDHEHFTLYIVQKFHLLILPAILHFDKPSAKAKNSWDSINSHF